MTLSEEEFIGNFKENMGQIAVNNGTNISKRKVRNVEILWNVKTDERVRHNRSDIKMKEKDARRQ